MGSGKGENLGCAKSHRVHRLMFAGALLKKAEEKSRNVILHISGRLGAQHLALYETDVECA